MRQTKSGKGLHRLFELAIFVKGADGVLETIGGLLILFVPLRSLDTKLFASIYLVGHGLVKIFLVYALWREKLWAFPAALWFIALFVVYQLYRFTHTHSTALVIFALLDICVAWFIWREYLARKADLQAAR